MTLLCRLGWLLSPALAILWPNTLEIRAPEGRGISKLLGTAVPSSIDSDDRCGAQRTIRTPLQSAALSILFLRTMHPTLFLPAGFKLAITALLAVVPVRLFFLNLCMVPLHVNQFFHSLYLRPPPRNLPEGDCPLSITNSMLCCFLQNGLKNLATRWVTHCAFMIWPAS